MKKRVNDVDFVQSGKVKVASVKDVVSNGLIRNLIHRLSFVNAGVCDMNIGRNLGLMITLYGYRL